MKQFLLWMAIVGLATTGCAQSGMLGPHARRGGGEASFQMARSRSMSGQKTRTTRSETNNSYAKSYDENDVELAMYGGRCRGCNGCNDCATGSFCDGGCDGGCDDACCGDGGCSVGSGQMGGQLGGGRLRGRVANLGGRLGGGCSSCGGAGCGLCQRVVGKVASGFCPHGGGYPASYNFTPSPPSGQVAYPYYTVRGPRDFLRNNPPSIGPY